MRKSRVLAKMRSGGIAGCLKLNVDNVRVAEIAAMSGIDCLWLDMEHVANDWSTIEAQILAAKAYDVDVMVRVGRGSYSDYIRPLEIDATGIMVPHIMSLEDARNVVRMTRFHPLGRRPIDGGNADGAYARLNVKEYIRQANDQRFLIFQIEDPEPVDDMEEIAALPGVDMLFFGPGDFSHSLGVPGEWQHPKLIETRRRVAEAARKHGKFAGTTGSVHDVAMFADMGYQFLGIGADVLGLVPYFQDVADEFAKIASARKASS
ncbi:MAG: aldolase/citrate lyase family protein [Acidobacteriota bacterium]|nr:aldolase/citrate lyase family protein [Acidobacteriota bacterium]